MRRQRSVRTAVLLAPAVLIGLAACGNDSDDQNVEGVELQLVELTGASIPDAANPTLMMEAGVASGDAGCNRFTGEYSLDGDRFEIGPLAVTLMACEPDVDEFERAYLEMLGAADTLEVVDDEVILSSDDGVGELRYERP